MSDKLKDISARADDINAQLSDPSVATDPDKVRDLMIELKKIQPVADKVKLLEKAEGEISEAHEILNDSSSDEELRTAAKEQLDDAQSRKDSLENDIKALLVPKDEDDDRNVIIEIRAGTGGEEAALFAALIYRMYQMYSDTHGFKTEVISSNPTELGGFKEIIFSVSGKGAYSRFKYESGVHRVQRVPETETQGRIQTSAITVAVMPEATDVEIEIDPKDLQFDVFRSSGAGGQKVNKTSSAVRLTYLPTGMVIECQDERSQYKNKDKALKVLKARLLEQKRREEAEKRSDMRRKQVGTGDRSERIRTYNFPQGRVTDHRINMSIYNIEGFINGDMDELIDALTAADTAEKLREAASDED
ncbi:MAG: peptide chain release factor 1 [Oscillospiraceae bacterium]